MIETTLGEVSTSSVRSTGNSSLLRRTWSGSTVVGPGSGPSGTDRFGDGTETGDGTTTVEGLEPRRTQTTCTCRPGRRGSDLIRLRLLHGPTVRVPAPPATTTPTGYGRVRTRHRFGKYRDRLSSRPSWVTDLTVRVDPDGSGFGAH